MKYRSTHEEVTNVSLIINHDKSESLKAFSHDQIVQILALDGGGLKGLFSASALKALEEHLGHSITEHFDLIAGTSTGGLIALGLGLGKSAKEIQEFYIKDGPKIFPNRGLKKILRFWKNWFYTKYSNKMLKETLQKLLVLPDADEPLLRDSTKRLLIPTFLAANSKPRILKTPHDPRLRSDWRLPMWAVAMATSAAPTYPPAFHYGGNRYLDGGLWANNPSLVAVVEAIEMGASLENIRVLNLSTTSCHSDCLVFNPFGFRFDYGTLGRIPWASKVLPVAMQAMSYATSHMYLRQLLKPGNMALIDRHVSSEHKLDHINFEEFKTIGEDAGLQSVGGLNDYFKHIAAPFAPDNTAIGTNNV